jgi:hypothetical protein
MELAQQQNSREGYCYEVLWWGCGLRSQQLHFTKKN